MSEHVVTESHEIVRGSASAPGRPSPVFLTCEHASERLPAPFEWPAGDARLAGTHWAFDLGARELTFELAEALGASAVVSRFSRLLVDPNRPEEHQDLFRKVAEGEPVLLNQSIGDSEREIRLDRYYRPYHAAVEAELARVKAKYLLSMHSYTPVYEGQVRNVQLGVLFDSQEEEALKLGKALEASFEGVAYNEPWSGRKGLMYSAELHAEKHGLKALELEVRQDLAVNAEYRARLVTVLARYFSAL